MIRADKKACVFLSALFYFSNLIPFLEELSVSAKLLWGKLEATELNVGDYPTFKIIINLRTLQFQIQ